MGRACSFVLREKKLRAVEAVEALVKKPIEDMGYELYEVEFQKEYGNWVLTVYIDRKGGVDLDDCEKISRMIDPMLDEADPIEQAYYLSVSSVGIDHPIKKDKDFSRNIGNVITVKLYAPMNGKKEFRGTLQNFDAQSFVIVLEKGEEITILRKDAASIKPYIEF